MRARHACAALPLVVALTLTATAAAQPPQGCRAPGESANAGAPRPATAAEKLAVLHEATRYVLSKLGVPVEARLFNSYSADPNARIQQLLNQSEDLRQISIEWQRIWSTEEPSHLTPERISDHQPVSVPVLCWPY